MANPVVAKRRLPALPRGRRHILENNFGRIAELKAISNEGIVLLASVEMSVSSSYLNLMTISECPTEPKNPSALRTHSRAAAGFEVEVAGSIGVDADGVRGVAIELGSDDPVVSIAGPFEGIDQEKGLGEATGDTSGEAVFFIDLGLGLGNGATGVDGEPAGEKTGGAMSGLGETDPFGVEVISTGVREKVAGERMGQLGDSLLRFGIADPFGFGVGATGVVSTGVPVGDNVRRVGAPASGLGTVDSLGVFIGTAVGVVN